MIQLLYYGCDSWFNPLALSLGFRVTQLQHSNNKAANLSCKTLMF